jgi:hypothetical protein
VPSVAVASFGHFSAACFESKTFRMSFVGPACEAVAAIIDSLAVSFVGSELVAATGTGSGA